MSFNPRIIACGRLDAEGKIARMMDIEGDGEIEAGKPYVFPVGEISVSATARDLMRAIGLDENNPLRSLASPEAVLAAKDAIIDAMERSGDSYVEMANEMIAFAEVGASIMVVE